MQQAISKLLVTALIATGVITAIVFAIPDLVTLGLFFADPPWSASVRYAHGISLSDGLFGPMVLDEPERCLGWRTRWCGGGHMGRVLASVSPEPADEPVVV